MNLKTFYCGKKVLVTGHTGFKGTWLCHILKHLDAEIVGYALESPTFPNLYGLCDMNQKIHSHIGDIADLEHLRNVFEQENPEIVIHMAAQPIVRESYLNPVYTYETNVMGTVHLLECIRQSNSVKSVVNVTTDKVYRNNEWDRGYIETDYLDGYDPYSNSKSCSELVTHSYMQSFLRDRGVAVSTCRAGNVIGGGDFAKDRIVPDCIRAAEEGRNIVVRNPLSTRPYQHVLEPLYVYLMIAMEQYADLNKAGSYNVGPEDSSCITTGELVSIFCNKWNQSLKNQLRDDKGSLWWIDQSDGGPHEANFLKLDCTKLKQMFHWKPRWTIDEALQRVIDFEKVRLTVSRDKDSIQDCINHQIQDYLREN